MLVGTRMNEHSTLIAPLILYLRQYSHWGQLTWPGGYNTASRLELPNKLF